MIVKKAYGKINLSLDVINKRSDNYHNIGSIMAKINLYDVLSFEKKDKGIEIIGDFDFNMEDNLIYKAYKLLMDKAGKDLGIRVKVEKNIPQAAGLAGGTADGCATLLALNELYSLNYSLLDLMKISTSLGADFPYMLNNKNMYAQGIGDILEPCGDFFYTNILILNPSYGISTPYVYNNLKLDNKRIDFHKLIDALNNYDYDYLKANLENKMESFVFSEYKDLMEIKNKLREFKGISLMSGSGPTIFSIFQNKDDLNRAYDFYKGTYKNLYKTCGGDFFGNLWF